MHFIYSNDHTQLYGYIIHFGHNGAVTATLLGIKKYPINKCHKTDWSLVHVSLTAL